MAIIGCASAPEATAGTTAAATTETTATPAAAAEEAATSAATTEEAATPAAATEAPAAEENQFPPGTTLKEGFDGEDVMWQAVGHQWDQWGGNSSTTAYVVSNPNATEGSKMWEADYQRLKEYDAQYFLDQPDIFDYTGVKSVQVDVFNPNTYAVNVYFAYQTTDNWKWNQFPAMPANSGLTKDIPFEFKGVEGQDDVKRVIFGIVMPKDEIDEGTNGKIFIDNIRISR